MGMLELPFLYPSAQRGLLARMDEEDEPRGLLGLFDGENSEPPPVDDGSSLASQAWSLAQQAVEPYVDFYQNSVVRPFYAGVNALAQTPSGLWETLSNIPSSVRQLPYSLYDIPPDGRVTDVPGEYAMPDGSIYRSGSDDSPMMQGMNDVARHGLEANDRFLAGLNPRTGEPAISLYDRIDTLGQWFNANSASGPIARAPDGFTLGAGANWGAALDLAKELKAGMPRPEVPLEFHLGELSKTIIPRIEDFSPGLAQDFRSLPPELDINSNFLASILERRPDHAIRLFERMPELTTSPELVLPNYNPMSANRPLLVSRTPNDKRFDTVVIGADTNNGRLVIPTAMVSPPYTIRKSRNLLEEILESMR